jgi:hypothetical protein
VPKEFPLSLILAASVLEQKLKMTSMNVEILIFVTERYEAGERGTRNAYLLATLYNIRMDASGYCNKVTAATILRAGRLHCLLGSRAALSSSQGRWLTLWQGDADTKIVFGSGKDVYVRG